VLLVSALSVFIRVKSLSFESEDYKIFLSQWISSFRELGFHSLGCNIGNYSPAYTELLILLSVLFHQMPAIIVAKLVQSIFDYVLGIICILIYTELKGSSTLFEKMIVWAVVILNPVVILNSAVWGQCDSIYTTFLVASVYLIIKSEKTKRDLTEGIFILFSLAFAFKLQAIFALPFLIFYMVWRYNILKLLTRIIWVPIIYTMTGIPMLIAKRSMSDILLVYFKQTGNYSNLLTMRYDNFYTLLGKWEKVNNTPIFWLGLITALVVLGFFFLYLLRNDHTETDELVEVAVCSVLIIVYLMPSMHERYGFFAEILLLVLSIKIHRFIPAMLLEFICTLVSYGEYLTLYSYGDQSELHIFISLIRLAIIVYMIHQTSHKEVQGKGIEIS
jgi:Gpi18-like mannosyltransferase